MEEKYKVGHKTFFGTLLAEAVKVDNSNQTVSLYEREYQPTYLVQIWDKDGNGREYEADRYYADTREFATELFTKYAFSTETLPYTPLPEIWDIPDEEPQPDTSPKSPSWGPWGQDGRKGN